jgi:iron complex outermembrane receptor protein
LFRDNPSLYSNYHTTDVYGSNVLANYIHGSNGTTSIGVDFRNETIFSNNLGEVVEKTIYSPVNDTIVLNRQHSRSNYSVFAGHKHYFNKLMVNVGLNLAHNTDIKNRWFLFPGVDLNYSFDGHSSIFASANKTMRMPTYTDLYYKSPSNEGNPNLLPEEAMGYELGYKLQNKFFDGAVTGFIIRGNNLIDWVKTNSADIWHTVNYTELNTTGFEFAAKANLKTIIPQQSILKEFKVNITLMDQNKIETEQISNYTLNYLKNRLDFDLGIRIWRNLGASLHVAYQDRNGEYLKYENNAAVGSVEYVSFTVADVKLFWIEKGWNIYASVNNLFDTTYYDYGNVPQPGRWLKIGVSKKIEFN